MHGPSGACLQEPLQQGEKQLKQIKDYFAQLAARDAYSGVVRITRSGEVLLAEAYGHASRAWRVPNTLDTRFDTASITKLFTAVATLQLVDEGFMELDSRIHDLIDLRDTVIDPRVTIFHLLTHTSGIGDDCEEEAGERYEDLWAERPNYAVRQTADFLPQFAHKPANFAPGEKVRYCNCSFVLLGLAIEKLTGRSYRDVVTERVFRPAGMTDSGFFPTDEVHPRLAEGADPIRSEDDTIVGWKRNIYSFPPIGSPDSGAYVTAADLERFLVSVQSAKLLSRELSDAFLTPQVTDRVMDGWIRKYAFGLWFYIDPDDEVVCYQKEGVNAGVSGLIRHFPKQDVTFVLLANMEEAVWKPSWWLHERIVKGELER
jgi:CubicO group peptidase (beta-lactamase class C family)